MMDISQLDISLKLIAEKKNQLFALDYNHEDYDQLEEQLHEIEDKLVDDFGSDLEDVFNTIHDEYCPDTDVLLPIAYLAKKYQATKDSYDVTLDEGVPVDADDYPGKESRLVLVPGPVRILLQINNSERVEVWKGEQSSTQA